MAEGWTASQKQHHAGGCGNWSGVDMANPEKGLTEEAMTCFTEANLVDTDVSTCLSVSGVCSEQLTSKHQQENTHNSASSHSLIIDHSWWDEGLDAAASPPIPIGEPLQHVLFEFPLAASGAKKAQHEVPALLTLWGREARNHLHLLCSNRGQASSELLHGRSRRQG